MRAPFLIVLYMLCAPHLLAQWEWTQAIQSNSLEPEWGHVVRYCPDSGLVITGQWRAEARFGSLQFTAPVANQLNALLVRYGSSGTPEWAHVFRSSDPTRSVFTYGLAVDADGNIVVGGHCPDTLLMDDAVLTFDDGGAGNIDAWFIAKFASDGTLLWAVDKEMATNGGELWDLDVDTAGDIWACGLISGSNSRAMKFSGDDGTVLFESNNIPGRMARVEVAADGSALLHGISTNTFQYGNMICPYSGVMGGSSTCWTIKVDGAGTAEWYYAPDQGSSGYPMWNALSMAATTDAYAFVLARPKTRIGNDTIAATSGQNGIYMLDPEGAPVWWRKMNTTGNVTVQDMVVAPDGSCWVIGEMNGTCDLIDTVVAHQGLFAFQYDNTGSVLQRLFGPNVVDARSVDARPNEVVIAGTQAGTMAFGEHTITDNWFGLFAARYGFVNSIGMPEVVGDATFSLFPNPARTHVRLNTRSTRPVELEVLNALGQHLMHKGRFDPQRDAIDLPLLPEGILFVTVGSGTERTTLRLMHQH